MAEKPRPTLADYVVTALSPMLIMGLVGSLVFFLVEILYAGKYEGRLLWTLFFFVFGIVLVSRISIEADAARASVYGLGLAFISWIALLAFIEYPKDSKMAPYAGFINLVLMGIVWWCGHKLTWDCTGIDEKRQASGRGLLAAAGLERRPETHGQARDADVVADVEEEAAEDLSFGERWRRFRERRRHRPHTPGLTVVWFSLAALPIFGLGQSLIPAGDSARRNFSFWLAACYVGCALGLLLTTSFLGLRRYLRQRRVPMPKAMAGVWLGLGGALVIAFVVVAALLPRPFSETPVWGLDKLTSAERKSSKNAQLKEGNGKGEEQAKGDNQEPADDEQKADSGKSGRKGMPQEKGDKGSGRDNDGKEQGEQGKGKGDQREEPNAAADRRFPDTQIGNALEKLVTFLKWLVFGLLALVVLAFLFRGALQYMANFMPGAGRWLTALFSWWERLWKRKPAEPVTAEPVKPRPVRRHFTSLTNPFADGSAEGMPIEDLIKCTFEALECWAADRMHPRRPDETPLEFSARLTNMFVSLEDSARNLALLVVRLAYANGKLPADARQILEHAWDRLCTTMPAQPANAD